MGILNSVGIYNRTTTAPMDAQPFGTGGSPHIFARLPTNTRAVIPVAGGHTAMTAVTGLPPTMADRGDEVTPMLAQYVDCCEQHPDALVLFQVGDFYEAFCEAAEAVARICEVTLTQREDSTGEYPMAGIPIDNAASYLEALVTAGYRVALATQVEDAAEATGLVDRAVTRVITPGTVVEDALLPAGSTTYVASVVERETDNPERDGYGIAAVDASTGECFVTTAPTRGDVREELDRIQPAELLVADDAPTVAPDGEWMKTAVDAAGFDPTVARDRLRAYVADPDRRLANDAERRARGAVPADAGYTQGGDGPLEDVPRIRRDDHRSQLRLGCAGARRPEPVGHPGAGSPLAGERREHAAGREEGEVQLSGGGHQGVVVVPGVDGLFALDQPLFDQRFGETAPLPGRDVELLPQVALVDAAGVEDDFERRAFVGREVGLTDCAHRQPSQVVRNISSPIVAWV